MASKASKTDGAAESTETETKGKKAKPAPKLDSGNALPETLYIVGLDDGFKEGEPGWDPELADPDRLNTPSDDYVTSLIEKGNDAPVAIVYKTLPNLGKVKVIADGRQRTMGTRAANLRIGDKAEPLTVPWYAKDTANALDVTRANEFRLIDSPLTKAKRAVRLEALGYKQAQIIGSFSDDGARTITRMTLINWKRAANCCLEIQNGFESGDYPITILYEIGKIKDEDPEVKAQKQLAALAKIQEEGGTLKGKAGRANASDATEEGDGDSSSDENSTPKTRSAKLSAEAIRELAVIFSSDEEEDGADDRDDYQQLVGALLAVIVGDDPTAKGLKTWPSVQKHVKKVCRSIKAKQQAKAEAEAGDTE